MSDTHGVQVWLWKNGDHYLGYTHLYPCFENGDPMALGEPAAKAIIKSSFPRELFGVQVGFGNALSPMPKDSEKTETARIENTKEIKVQGQ